jgi:hypothetical protein
MKHDKPSKQQADRLLKQLPLRERRRQQQLRHMIANDPMFKVA